MNTRGYGDFDVKVGGKSIVADSKFRIGDLRLHQPIDDHHTASVECYSLLSGEDFAVEALDNLQSKLGDEVVVEIGGSGGADLSWTGLLTGAEARITEEGGYAVTVHASSLSVKLDGNPRNRAFQKQKISDVVTSLCGEAGLTAKVDATKTSYDHLDMAGESDYRFLRRVLAAEGLYFRYDGATKEMVASAKSAGSESLKYGKNLISFSLKANAMPTESMVTSYDVLAKKTIKDKVKSANVKGGNQLADATVKAAKDIYKKQIGDRDVEIQGESMAALEADSVGLAKTFASRMFLGSGVSNVVALTCGVEIDLGEAGNQISGKYFVTGVTHRFDADGYRNEFTCIPSDAAGPRRFPKPNLPTFRTGLVTALNKDELAGFAVKVKWVNSYGGTQGESESGWLRVLMPHAGKDHGFAMLPEIEDEVIVAFEGSDLSKGIVVGSVYNGKDKGATAEVHGSDEENNHKIFTTRSGHRLHFSDEDGSEFIELVTGDGQHALKLDVGGKAITITTEGELKVKATKAMSFESQDAIKFKATKNIEMEAKGDIVAKATGKANIEGMEVNTNAKMKSTLKAGMQVEVKGGSGTVKAGVTGVDVQGPLVKLN